MSGDIGDLSPRARALRVAHAGYAVVALAAVGSIWTAAITKRRNRFLGGSLSLVAFEATALIVGRGDCPLTPIQARAGDPLTVFELVLPPRAASHAIPVLAAITTAGLTTVALHWPLERSGA